MTSRVFFYGKNPLEEFVLALRRNQPISLVSLYLTKQAEENPSVMSLVQSAKLPYKTVTSQEIDSMVGKDTVHQGICGEIVEDTLYTPLPVALERAKKRSEKNNTKVLAVLLDELQDPHNVGAIIRSAVAFGASFVLMPLHDQVQINHTVIKSSSGMSFAIPVVRIKNVNNTLSDLKEKGFWTYALVGDGDTSLHTAQFDTDTVLVVGGEGAGVRKKTEEVCDFRLSIETDSLCESLNASNAAAVSMYEWSRQQK